MSIIPPLFIYYGVDLVESNLEKLVLQCFDTFVIYYVFYKYKLTIAFALGTLSFPLFLVADPPLSLLTTGTTCARREMGWHRCDALEPAMEDNRVLSRPDEGGAKRSLFSWLLLAQ
jgi:hypothetical protein